jgi:uncharacterized protein (DUF952 family)
MMEGQMHSKRGWRHGVEAVSQIFESAPRHFERQYVLVVLLQGAQLLTALTYRARSNFGHVQSQRHILCKNFAHAAVEQQPA